MYRRNRELADSTIRKIKDSNDQKLFFVIGKNHFKREDPSNIYATIINYPDLTITEVTPQPCFNPYSSRQKRSVDNSSDNDNVGNKIACKPFIPYDTVRLEAVEKEECDWTTAYIIISVVFILGGCLISFVSVVVTRKCLFKEPDPDQR